MDPTPNTPISVAATVLNEVADIPALLASLASQTLPPAEILIVDGGSTDGTWEWLLDAQAAHPSLTAIQDPTCNLRSGPGPIARGRNVAIARASSPVIATADAGCTYAPDWLLRLAAPILSGASNYALGGSCLHPSDRTLADLASAPFFGVKLTPEAPTKSCTARSMAFQKSLWTATGGFPETVFLGEDTLFDAHLRTLTRPAFPPSAKALYRPRHTWTSALRQLALYARADGVLGVRPARFLRNLLRCLAELIALALLPATALPLAAVLLLEIYFAFRLDWHDLRHIPRALPARLLFSLLVPWIVTWNQLLGHRTRRILPNRQNTAR